MADGENAHSGMEEVPFEAFEQDEAFDALGRLMKSERPPIALVGAGASIRSGYVSWSGLLECMENHLGPDAQGARWKATLAQINDAPWTAEVHCRAMGNEAFKQLINTQFGPRQGLAEPHLTLGEMRFRHYLTTNYDPCIETALTRAGHPFRVVRWDDAEELSNFLIRLSEPGREKSIVYLHGRYDRPADIVLTESSYVSRYVSSDDARRKLLAIFMTHPVVFVGFSMNDPDFANLMREVTARLRARPPAHFALIGYNSVEERDAYRARMTDKFGVRPIFYSRNRKAGEDEYGNLLHLLDALEGRPRRSMAEVARKGRERVEVDPNDPQKGSWGGSAEANGRRLSVKHVGDKGRWVTFELKVEPTNGRPLAGEVEFHLHPTFKPPVVKTLPDTTGTAVRQFTSYGAFTVGVSADGGATKLEMDLALQVALPTDWRQR